MFETNRSISNINERTNERTEKQKQKKTYKQTNKSKMGHVYDDLAVAFASVQVYLIQVYQVILVQLNESGVKNSFDYLLPYVPTSFESAVKKSGYFLLGQQTNESIDNVVFNNVDNIVSETTETGLAVIYTLVHNNILSAMVYNVSLFVSSVINFIFVWYANFDFVQFCINLNISYHEYRAWILSAEAREAFEKVYTNTLTLLFTWSLAC